MSTEMIFWIIVGVADLTATVFYIRRAINEIVNTEGAVKTSQQAEIKLNHAKAKAKLRCIS